VETARRLWSGHQMVADFELAVVALELPEQQLRATTAVPEAISEPFLRAAAGSFVSGFRWATRLYSKEFPVCEGYVPSTPCSPPH
jgi:hypothetical protein